MLNIYLCGICILGALAVARAQTASGEKVVRVTDFLRITDPVMITNISVDGKP